MGGPRFVEFEACAVRKGWLTPDQLSGAIHLYEAYAASGDVRPLADICVAEGYLTPEQAVELTGQVKFPASCPSCGARFKIGGRKPEKGWTCARCGGALRPVNELLAVPPAEKKPAPTGPKARRNREPLGAAQGRPESEAPPRPKSKRVLWISAGGAAVAVLIVVLAVAISGTDESRPAPSPAGGTQLTTDPGKEQARLDAVREEWARASEALEAFRKDPSLASRTLALLEPLAERAKGTTYEAPARRGMEEIRAAAAREDEKALGPVRELVERGDLHAAASLIKTHLDDPATPPTLSSSLKQLQARIAERAPASYDRLLNEARRLASESRSNDARAHLLRATAWGIPEYALRARKDADGLGGTAPANLPPPPAPVAVVDPAMLKSALEERARAEFGKLENDADRLVQAGKLQEAIARCEAFLAEYRQTSAGAPAERRLALLRSQIAAAPAEKPAPGTRPAEPGVTVGAPRKPRDAGIRPGMLSEEEKKKKHAELAGEARKEQKGALKAAAARRSEWLAGLEKEFGIYDITTLVDKGDVAKRVDVVIVSSGYPKADAKKVDTLADALKAALVKVDPFQNYPDYINFHRIKVDDPAGAGGRARVPFQVQNNILTCDRGKAIEYARQAPSFDLVVVLCNVSGVRATGGPPVITIDADLDIGRTFLHEMGHAFASLSDEYVDEGLAPGRPFREENEEENEWLTNVTAQKNPKLAKWHYWTLDVWPAAHEAHRLPPGHKVGCFEGAAYQARGVYRPEAECLMRMGDKYCVVCFEQVERKFYRLIAPIDDARPRRHAVGYWIDETVTLEADAIRTMASGGERIGKFEGFWYVDGKDRHANAKNLTTTLTVPAGELGAGLHEAGLRVDFSNKRVRRDDGWLSSSAGWKVDVSRYKKPRWEGPAGVVQGRVGQPVSFDMRVENPDSASFRTVIEALPQGSSFENGKFAWTPQKADQGAWRPRFVLTDGLRTVEKAVEIAVLDVAEKNYDPVFSPMEAKAAAEGESIELGLDVVDVDGDNLVFTSPNLPEGAQLDVYEGVIRWKPGPRQAGRYPGIVVEVFDGRRRVKGTVELVIEDKPRALGPKDDLLVSLRSPSPQIRAAALGELGSGAYARTFRFMEAARLLRDKSRGVRGAALSSLQALVDSSDATFAAMMIRDLAPHAWHFTDHKEILSFLDALAAKGAPGDPDAKALRGALRAIEKYNKDRGF